MTRCESSKKGIYEFFKEIDKYIEAENSADSTTPPPKTSSECNYFSTLGYNSENPSLAKEICEKFVKRYKTLNPTLIVSREDLNYKNNWAFLNYWLNYELNKSTFNKNTCVKNFYNYMENYIFDILEYGFFISDEIFDINKDELDKLHILFNLYSNYHQIINEANIACNTKDTCLDYSKKCVLEYKKGIIQCPNNISDFCKVIEQFKIKYDGLKSKPKSSRHFSTSELISLPSHEEALNEYPSELNKKITIVTISILCSIFGIILILFYLYKFTPFGKWLPINKKNQEKRHAMKEKMYNFIDNSNEYSTYNEYTPYRFGYNST
ncbi:hypothetical protein PVPAM_000044800 [Plasmodium vivax]|nr:hypothetical protein PVPAM_000044800 [Plasmodium vivax]